MCSLVLYYMNGSDNKGKENNISRVKVRVSRPLWCARADGSPCQGMRLVTEWTASGVLCAASQSLWRLQNASGWPLTHAAINYCLLLSSILNKGIIKDADKKCDPSAWKEREHATAINYLELQNEFTIGVARI